MIANKVYPAKQINIQQRQNIAIQAISNNSNINNIAAANQVSRNFIYTQKNKALQGITAAFSKRDSEPLFYIPLTLAWLKAFILCLILHCRASYRGIQSLLEDCFDYPVSLGAINNLVTETASTAKKYNTEQNLKAVTFGANDELFNHQQPILVGVDISSLYCCLLSQEKQRDADTTIKLLDLQKQGYKPERIIADDADGLRNGHASVLSHVPCDYDNFHITRDLKDLRRYFRNELKSQRTDYIEFADKAYNSPKQATRDKYLDLLPKTEKAFHLMQHLSPTIDILISWLEHDVLNMPGKSAKERHELYNFILVEFEKLADIHPHRIQAICTKLRNQRKGLLAFVDVLDCKFYKIALKHQCLIGFVWKVFNLQRCEYSSDTYHVRAQELINAVGVELFDAIEEDVLVALDSTERTSSMVENYNGRIKSHLRQRKECNQQFLNLLRFYYNHVPFRRSARSTRVKKSPAKILTGKPHSHWLEMLGYSSFKRVA